MGFESQLLESLCALIVDCPHSTPLWTDSGFIVLRNQNIKNGRLDLSAPSFTDAEHFADRNRRAKPTVGDIVITREAPMGDVCIVPDGIECCLGQRQVLLRPDPALVSPRFLHYALQSVSVQRQIAWSEGTGSTVSNLRIPVLKALIIPTPPRVLQDNVAETLGALDDRIDLLRQINATLEAIAQALFKSWFVDFDPVRAKAEGREPEGMDAATAALFPSEFEESELGLIPKGWRVVPFGDAVAILGGGTPKTSVAAYWDGNIPWFSVVDAPASGQMFTLDTIKKVTQLGLENCSAKLLPPLTTIISARGTVGKVALTGCDMAMNQSCYGLRPKVAGGESFVYFSTVRFVDHLKRIAHGAVFDTITRSSFDQVSACVPPDDLLTCFGKVTAPLLERIRTSGFQAKSLIDLRDTLLPRLISGKLRLPETESLIETTEMA